MVLQALLGEHGTVDEAQAAQHMRAHDRGTADMAQVAQWGGTVMTHK